MAALKVGLVGCGRIAQSAHIGVLRSLPGVELVAVADSDPDRLREVRQRAPLAQAFAHYRDLLEKADVSAVVICLPNSLHAESASAAFGLGKHVYLEKPLATAPDEAAHVLRAWRDAGTVGMVGFNYRFNRLYRSARDRIRSGALGSIMQIKSAFVSTTASAPNWKVQRSTGGGALLDLGSHHVDLARFLTGAEIESVAARVTSRQSEDDTALVDFRLGDGVVMQSLFAYGNLPEDRLEVFGSAGKLVVDRLVFRRAFSDHTMPGPRVSRLARELRAFFSAPYLLDSILAPRREPSYKAALSHFVACIEQKTFPESDLLDGCRSLAVILAAEEAARRREVVMVSAVRMES